MGKAAILMEALPYIRRFSGTIVVVKYGGSAMDDPSFAQSFARDVALLSQVGIKMVVVHGGGPQITAAMKREGIAPTWVDGLRVTNSRTMELVRRVLGGEVNGEIARLLETSGASAVGLNGVDAGLFRCRRLDNRLGRVGDLVEVNPALVEFLVDGGMTPVVAPLGLGLDGEVYNLNADTVAGALAAALGAQKLVFLTNVEGVYRNPSDASTLISKLTLPELVMMVDRFRGGMLPKLRAVVEAMKGGVSQAHVLDGRIQHALLLEMFTPEGIGTMVIHHEGEEPCTEITRVGSRRPTESESRPTVGPLLCSAGDRESGCSTGRVGPTWTVSPAWRWWRSDTPTRGWRRPPAPRCRNWFTSPTSSTPSRW